MPRQPRLDAPGVLHHVMARGIERRAIFIDDKDRKGFLDRLSEILEKTQTQCYAWSLIPNHYHLLLRTASTPLSKVMRRLMTGYAVTFNHRHHRAGHLFQNRYKSVVCEEDTYLLELIRYIHLNPLRAKLVADLDALDHYPWVGHSTLMGNRKNPLIPEMKESPCPNESGQPEGPRISIAEKTVDDVLKRFGETLQEACRNYREFVEKGIALGRRPELQAGGLIRRMGGKKAALKGIRQGNIEKSDPRILGSGAFVSLTLEQSEKILEKKYLPKRSIEELIELVANGLGISQSMVCSGSRQKKISEARALVSYIAVEVVGHGLTDVARFLGVKRVSMLASVNKGKKLISNYPLLLDIQS